MTHVSAVEDEKGPKAPKGSYLHGLGDIGKVVRNAQLHRCGTFCSCRDLLDCDAIEFPVKMIEK